MTATFENNADGGADPNPPRLPELIDVIPDATFAIDLRGRLIAWNQAMTTLTGVSAAQVLGKGDYEYAAAFYGVRRPMLIDLALEWDAAVAARYGFIERPDDKLISEIEYPNFGRKGQTAWFWKSAKKIHSPDGDCIGAVEVICDITLRHRMDDALHSREKQYRQIVETADEGIWIIDRNNRTVFANAKMAEMLGCPMQELKDRSLFDFIDPPWQDIAWNYVERRREGIAEQHDFKFRRTDGAELWALIATNPIQDADGRYTGALAMVTDITERKRIEERLLKTLETEREISEELQTIMNLVPAAVWISRDPGCHTITGNQYANDIYQAQADENVSARQEPNSVDTTRRFLKDGRELSPDELPMQQAAATGREIRNAEIDVQLPDGRFRALLGNASPLFDARGKVRGSVGAFLDISERKEQEEKLKLSHQRFISIIQTIPSMVFEGDAVGHNTFASEQWHTYTGLSPAQTQGDGWTRALHPEDADQVRKAWVAAMRSGDMFQSRHRLRKRDGSYRWFIARSMPARDEHGRIVHWMGSLTDIDDQVAIEAALRQRETELEKWNTQLEQRVKERTAQLETSNAALRELARQTIQAMENDRKALSKELHDSIGGTLAAIRYQLESRVENTGPAPPTIAVPLERIIAYLGYAVQETRRITKQLRPSVLDDFGLVAAVQDYIHDFQAFHPEIKILRTIDIHEEKLSSNTKTVLYRVLQEILNNAGKHSRADTVRIRLREHLNDVHLEVEDNGIGFDLDRSYKTANMMENYGLHSMRERIEICKGSFRIRSAPGKGTTISTSVPIDHA